MVNSSFYVVNFLLLIRSSFSFYMVKSTFYLVNFLFFISISVKSYIEEM